MEFKQRKSHLQQLLHVDADICKNILVIRYHLDDSDEKYNKPQRGKEEKERDTAKMRCKWNNERLRQKKLVYEMMEPYGSK